ncbi:type II secretion system protein [Clostridium botulinum]|uniref:N-terminal cleavage protein n=1 Tax=Clostridium botulinum TaxID=1491 RepID=A0A9Q1UXR9_CLOBO|nr:type II secretion system protein [Clostridium botulinum]KLU76787.1 N-terminal cleavage protein [Clostridium botulinum V891]KOA74896.1 N-terminal cleavage protein [Clostridium botulinum]KOA75186.1 N-terminal cleavage protein [Clostridium botulinum]KOA82361.1 N-terminal cleavage protein [Clostridium botulinum]KOA85400.1 N-terminal cleavage protein [Clostridium botulinum]
MKKNLKVKFYIKSKTKGFTLIELIVVMAIILVMASFLIPKFNGYRGKAQRLKVVDTGRQIYLTAMESYAENNGKFNNQKLLDTSKELLGIDNLQILNAGEDNFVINYHVDEKPYILKFNKNENDFCIEDNSGSKLYPNNNEKNDIKTYGENINNGTHKVDEGNKKSNED